MLLSPQEYIAHQFTKIKNKETENQALYSIDLLNRKFLLEYQLNEKSDKIVVKNLTVPQNEGMTKNVNYLKN